jgi:alpha-beta hydrolase superfamily lysophospholipase
MHVAAVSAAAYVGVSLVAGWVLAQMALHPDRRPLTEQPQLAIGWPADAIGVSARDGAILRAWYARPNQPNGQSVILLHGMADNREGVAGYASMFLRRGYAVLLPDSRAHGESGGALPTYGVLERNDVRQWAAWLHQGAQGCEYLFGESMGAAIAIQASAVTPGLCAVAAESSFATFREIANDRISQMTGLGLWFPLTVGGLARETAIAHIDLRDRVNLADASPLQAIRQSRVPALLICGTADDNIPMRHSQELFRAGASHAELWIVQGARHTGASAVDSAEFERRVTGWFANHTSPQ